tara:strand:- start:2292 stop:3323 length:1032 start_codon:yes stop_codon:yes gene_type:complete
MTKYYEILGVSRNASIDDIKSAHRKLAREHHPDKGGNPDRFREIQEAFETLSDSNKRQQYDQPARPQAQRFNFQSNFGDVFSQFFQQNVQRHKQVVRIVKHVPLDTLYNGGIVKMKITRKACCRDCSGEGGDTVKCDTCDGKGKVQTKIQIGNMTQISVINCPHCTRGKKFISKCKICTGSGTIQEESVFSLNINAGTEDGTAANINDGGDYNTESHQYADIQFIIKQDDHPRLTRQGSTLVLQHTISLYESLCGFSFKYVHLDSKTYHIRCLDGSSEGNKHIIKGMGMLDGYKRGDLIIEIHVHKEKYEFNVQEQTQLKRILKFNKTELETEKDEIQIIINN